MDGGRYGPRARWLHPLVEHLRAQRVFAVRFGSGPAVRLRRRPGRDGTANGVLVGMDRQWGPLTSDGTRGRVA